METREHGYLIRVTPNWEASYSFGVYHGRGRRYGLKASGRAPTEQAALDLARLAIRKLTDGKLYPKPLDKYPSAERINAKRAADLHRVCDEVEREMKR